LKVAVLVVCNEDAVRRFDADIPLYCRPGCLVVVVIALSDPTKKREFVILEISDQLLAISLSAKR
jgi:hypothetical protein